MAYNVSYNVGSKFNADGSVRFFPGNTVISMIDHGAPVFEQFKNIRAMFKALPASRCMSFMPDESIHMTIFEGVCHQWRRPEAWTTLLPLDCALSETDDLFEQRFARVRPLRPVHMRAQGIAGKGCFLILFAPETEGDAAELKRYRDDLSAAFGLRFPNHDTYGFHISIGYFTKEPTEQECAQIEAFRAAGNAYIAASDIRFVMQPPVLTYFDDMFFFSPTRIPRYGL